jgi:anti-anti-sigma factor
MEKYIIEVKDGSCRVTMSGDLIASVVTELQAALKEKMQQDVHEIVFDLATVVMLDSSGIGLLIAASNTVGRLKGRIGVVNVSPDILQLLQSMRLAGRLNATGRKT